MENTPVQRELARHLAEVRACTLCAKDLPLGPKPIFRLGSNAKILIAGQAPGRITHAIGHPFDDPSGDRLRSWMGIDRAIFYDETKIAIVPMGLCYPGTGKSGDLPPGLLSNIQLTLVIGQYAIDWHMPNSRGQTLTENVADWRSSWPTRLAMPHPSPRNNLWLKRNPWFEADVLPVLRQSVRMLID